MTAEKQNKKLPILQKAAASAFRGGLAGFIAMILQVILLMWLRTVVNYQYKHGGSIAEAFSALYADGGVWRFYQGVFFALITGPLSRFGDTAANEGVRELLSETGLSVALVTFCASFAAALWRIVLTPIDTLKTSLQVSGKEGFNIVLEKTHKYGFFSLFDGALGNWASTIVGHYPWFAVNNKLEQVIPKTTDASSPKAKLIRRAFIGFCSSVVSDICSNGIRVVKTYKQTSDVPLTYSEALASLIEQSGIFGFLIRGLGMKLLSNALSSILFSVLWKMIMERFQSTKKQSATTATTAKSKSKYM
jgi:hypothetical protein